MLILRKCVHLRQTFNIKNMKRKLLMFMMMLFSILSVNASENDPTESDGKLTSILINSKNSSSAKPRRTPTNVDILLLIDDNSITIRFNGDFGQGNYLVTDLASGYSASGTVIATSGSSEVVSFPVSSSSSFDFYIEFEDGYWCHLTWNAE